MNKELIELREENRELKEKINRLLKTYKKMQKELLNYYILYGKKDIDNNIKKC